MSTRYAKLQNGQPRYAGDVIPTKTGFIVKPSLAKLPPNDVSVNAARASRANAASAVAKAALEARRRADEARAAWESANLPSDLAALRALQRMAAETNEVTVIVTP